MREWRETYSGGSADAEYREFQKLAQDIMLAQLKARSAAKLQRIDRAFHAKATLALDGAELRFLDTLPPDLVAGHAQPGASYGAIVRFSNAASVGTDDNKPDLRGIAIRYAVSENEHHDLLATNFPVSHARDAHQFVAFAVATAGGSLSRIWGLFTLLFTLGPSETIRMLRNIAAGRQHQPTSVALESYWSRGAIRWGEKLAVRYLLRPEPGAKPAPFPTGRDPDYLSREAAIRLAEGPIRLELCVQRFVDEKTTPIEDTAAEWLARAAPPVPVAILTIPKQDVSLATTRARWREIEEMAFNPWNTTEEFRPLGNLNRARKAAYDASAAHRRGWSFKEKVPLRNRILGAGAHGLFKVVNRFIEWHRLPLRTSLLNLDVLRSELRKQNLIDTEPREAPPQARDVPPPPPEEMRTTRSFDGSNNDLSAPKMGAVGAAFGRNIKPDFSQNVEEPNPITVSRELLHRKVFLPARSLNLLAASWIQFQVHDWVAHARYPLGEKDVKVPLPKGVDSWLNVADGQPEGVMRIAGNRSLDGDDQRLFANEVSHWWDGSEVYGADSKAARALREGPKLRLDNGYLPEDVKGFEITGFRESWWLGLSGLHTLFAREHNVLCDELRAHYPLWSDDQVYNTARLIVSALIAKIHTVEWTPAILATRAIDVGLNANWNGPPANDWLTRLGIWAIDVHAATGIPQTRPDHHGAPYCLTEDFATVYRLHPLIPDDYVYYDSHTGEKLGERTFLDIQGAKADDELRSLRLHNLLYSFGIAHPGAITLHNNPRSLEGFERNGERIDLSVVDIVRTRRRGVPRYNDFRTGLHKPRITRWEDICNDPESVRIMRDIYRGDIDKVDTMVGLFAEPCPQGFGFSDTAFRIFILMATRRLQSDRFLTVDLRPEIYSPLGMDWVANNGMTSIILRHCPELAAVLPRDTSAFAPWRPVAAQRYGS
ncbi:MAG: peroxidase family protein [Rhodoplanes sp.]